MVPGRRRAARSAAAAVATGRGVAVLGPLGVGRTAFARALVEELDPARFATFWVSATEAGAPVPFGAFAALLSADETGVEPALVFGRLVRELGRRAGRRTPVLVVDDAHHLDGPSAGVLLGVVTGGLARAVITARGAAPPPDAVAALWKDGWLDRVDLADLDRDGTAALAAEVLGGPVAEPTVELLHRWTGGNPRALSELVRHGRSAGSVVQDGGLWWWRAAPVVPPALGELLDRRIDALDTPEVDALAAVALGEPLPVDVLDEVASLEVSARLEDAALIRTEDAGDRLVARLDHPLLAAAVRRRLSPARRRRIAAALLDAAGGPPRTGPEVVTRALWQLEARGDVDVALLLAGAEAALHADPHLAARLARRAAEAGGGVAAAIALSDALIESGEPAAARTVLEDARARAASPEEAWAAALALAGHRAWSGRDPVGAYGDLQALRRESASAAARAEVDSVTALVLLFSARTAAALALADEVLALSSMPARVTIRAGLARATALTLVGRTAEALTAADDVAARAAAEPAGVPYAAGMALAARALAQLWRTPLGEVPTADPVLGRWPIGSAPPVGLAPTTWSLFDGYVRRLLGDLDAAAARLREALVQQAGGEGLFRSEAAAWLALSLAEAGRPGDAAAVLRDTPPDAVAIVPGLGPWAAAAVAAARRDTPAALEAIDRALADARAAGAFLVELGYLTYAAELRRGGAVSVADRVTTVVRHVDAPRLVASADATLALARGDGAELLEHARRLVAYGLGRTALRLAEAAVERLPAGAERAEAEALAASVRASLGISPAPDQEGLTSREAEVARLAARGLSDREIAERLVLSVRTVESHLSRTYRKLGVASRAELPAALE